jgi:ketosteroid isomerase-like protein
MARTEDLARQYYTVVDSGDADATIALFAPEATYDRPGYDTLTGPQIGEFYRGERVIASGAHTVHEIIADDTRAAIRGVFDGVLKDGSTAREGFADFMEFDDQDRISARTTFFFRAAV